MLPTTLQKTKAKHGRILMDELKKIQRKIDFIASEIREHKIELHKLHKELHKAIDEQQKLKQE